MEGILSVFMMEVESEPPGKVSQQIFAPWEILYKEVRCIYFVSVNQKYFSFSDPDGWICVLISPKSRNRFSLQFRPIIGAMRETKLNICWKSSFTMEKQSTETLIGEMEPVLPKIYDFFLRKLTNNLFHWPLWLLNKFLELNSKTAFIKITLRQIRNSWLR